MMFMCVPWHTWRSEDNSVKLILSLHLYEGCSDWTQVTRLACRASPFPCWVISPTPIKELTSWVQKYHMPWLIVLTRYKNHNQSKASLSTLHTNACHCSSPGFEGQWSSATGWTSASSRSIYLLVIHVEKCLKSQVNSPGLILFLNSQFLCFPLNNNEESLLSYAWLASEETQLYAQVLLMWYWI